MEISYEKIKKIFPDFNVKPLGENEFWAVAKERRILVVETPLLFDGYYKKKRGKHIIVINSNLRGMKWIHTAFHELMHYFLDVPPSTREIMLLRTRDAAVSKREKIADALALMAILPLPELEKLHKEDLEEHPSLAPLVVGRIQALAEFGK